LKCEKKRDRVVCVGTLLVYSREDLHKPMHFQLPRQLIGSTSLYFNEARDDGVAVASAGPYANRLHLTSNRFVRPSVHYRSVYSVKNG